MPRTIDDNEYAHLQNRKQVADFVESIYNDPALTKEAKALIKKKYPQMAIPDYDIETRVEERLAADRKEREDKEAAQRREKEDSEFQNLRRRTQDTYGFTDEGMQDLEKFMVENNVGNYDVAATYVASKQPKPSDAGGFNNGLWNHGKAPGFEEIAKDPEGWGRNEILKTLNAMQEKERNQRF